ncbi:zinc finger protein [Saccharothrix xinjiangensis]|uniref:Zinc finger protein n=1 Tax=Saccharothrix xinjiangensis TaxID=204798 RepID=A0ABV9Y976_9PSEU
MALRPFRWQPHDHQRHAVAEDALAYQDTTTLCGKALTIPATHLGKEEWCWPTCPGCDTAWRLHEGIPLFPRQRTATSPSTVRGRVGQTTAVETGNDDAHHRTAYRRVRQTCQAGRVQVRLRAGQGDGP